MQQPVGPEVHILNLIPGEKYYGFSNRKHLCSYFRATFDEYFVNAAGYNMVRFLNVSMTQDGHTDFIGPPEKYPLGIYWRVWDQGFTQSFKYYKAARLTAKEQQELKTRVVLRERRQYERGLTGTNNSGLWIPRDLVREISLKYLTDPKVGCAGRWR